MHSDGVVSITLNGEQRRATAGISLADLAASLGLVPAKVAVERNREIVPRSTLAQVLIAEGDEIEIVHFVGGGMAASRIVTNLSATDAAQGRSFFTDMLGLEIAMELDFITTYRAPGQPNVQISVLAGDPSGFAPDYSVGVDDVAACHATAMEQSLEIVYPLTDEPWGVRRFFVRDPLGRLANIVEHKD
jgi:thiamine biosynthesis protein ThiS